MQTEFDGELRKQSEKLREMRKQSANFREMRKQRQISEKCVNKVRFG